MKIAIIGCGAYGLALALQLQAKNEVVVYTKFPQEKYEVDELNYRENVLPGVLLSNLHVTLSMEEALKDASFVIFAVPFPSFEKTLVESLLFLEPKSILVVASKGLDLKTAKTAPEIVSLHTSHKLLVLSGPTFAMDLAQSQPVQLTIASHDERDSLLFASCFPSHITFEFSKDLIGISYCGAIKNVFAILQGYLVGKNASISTQAAILYQSLRQLQRILNATKCSNDTLLSASGVADFYMSAESKNSRNHTFGILLATKTKEEILSYFENTTVEGVSTLKACQELCKKNQLQLPILDILDDIISGKDISPLTILEALLQ